PPSPCTGSMMMAAVLSETSFSTDSILLNSAKNVPPTYGAKKGCLSRLYVTLADPYVRPWNEFLNAIISLHSGPLFSYAHLRAHLIAASTASVPLLQK